jgi:hypothetical protein
MVFIKFNFLLFLICATASAQTRFDSKACLNSTYTMKMVHKGPLFGLLSQEFILEKKNCIINIFHKKYLPREWIVDVCREPVHIKVTSATGVDVAKKEGNCIKQDKSRDTGDFCAQYFALMDVIQDDGLIFADGDRDDIASAHGKTYCAYLLLKKYLNESVVFSRYTDIKDIFEEIKKPLIVPEPLMPKEGEEVPSEKSTKLDENEDKSNVTF